jgi:hypothetical protein
LGGGGGGGGGDGGGGGGASSVGCVACDGCESDLKLTFPLASTDNDALPPPPPPPPSPLLYSGLGAGGGACASHRSMDRPAFQQLPMHVPTLAVPSVMCDVISVAAEFMLSVVLPMHVPTLAVPSVMCDVISVATEFMLSVVLPMHGPTLAVPSVCGRNSQSGKRQWTPGRNAIGHTHGSASSGAKAWNPMAPRRAETPAEKPRTVRCRHAHRSFRFTLLKSAAPPPLNSVMQLSN